MSYALYYDFTRITNNDFKPPFENSPHECVSPLINILYMSRDMRFPTMWNVRPAKAQTSLRIRAV